MTPHQGGDVMWAEVGWGTGVSSGTVNSVQVLAWASAQEFGKGKESKSLAREPRSESTPAVPKVTLAFPATSFFKGFWFSNFILVHSVLWPYSLPITLFSSLLLTSLTTSPPLCVSSQVGLIQGATHRFTIARSLHIQFHCAQVTLFWGQKIKAGNSASAVSSVRGCFTRFHCGGRRLIYFQ